MHVTVDEARRRLLANCVESCMELSEGEEAEFNRLLEQEQNKELRKMRKSWMEQCEERGEKRGEVRAKRETLITLMRAKFGGVPAEVSKIVSAIENRRRLDTLLRRILTARTLADMGLGK